MKKILLTIALFLLTTGTLLLGAESSIARIWLDDLDVSQIECGFGYPRKGKTLSDWSMTVSGVTYERGVGLHAPGYIFTRLPQQEVHFHALFGIPDETEGTGHFEYLVYSDRGLLWRSGFMKGNDPIQECDLTIDGDQWLLIYLDEGNEGNHCDYSVVTDAYFETENSPEAIQKIQLEHPLFADKNGIVRYALDTDTPKDREIQSQYNALSLLVADPLPASVERNYQLITPNGEWIDRMPEKVIQTARDQEACVLPSDRDPLDIVLRRTERLLTVLKESCEAGTLDDLEAKWNELSTRCAAEPFVQDDTASKQKRYELFCEVSLLRDKIALRNPLLKDFNDILFIKRHYNPEPEKEGNHMCDQFFGFHARPGGGLFVLKDAISDHPQLVNLTENATISNGRLAGQKLDSTWGFLSPHLAYDGKTIFFAAADTKNPRHSYTWTEDNCYHLFKINIDGTGLTQLTDGPWNDFDPYFMPNGRIVFISERRGGYGRCHARPCPSYTLHSMNPDGTDIVPLSVHETNEWAPMVDHNGMIVYTRWDYVDRGFNQAHHPWITFPDGRDSRAIQGNYSDDQFSRPHFETSFKPIPDSHLLVGTACGHHTQNFGSIILLDPLVEDDDTGNDPMAPIRRVTPDQPFPESETRTHAPPHVYGQPFPLSEEFFLVVYDCESRSNRGEANDYGIYLLDIYGNKTLIYRDPKISCQHPIPVFEREVPPVIPHQTLVGIPEKEKSRFDLPEELPQTATVGVTNIYSSTRPFPEGTKIKELRIVQILPKTTTHANAPWIGFAGENGARRVLGTVPVEEDGSARFEMPVNIPFYMQALDEEGVAVQTMRSATYVHPGETLTCLGCHEGRFNASQNSDISSPKAFQRAPSTIAPDVPGSNPFNYPTLVQPILDKHCVACHEEGAKEGKTFELNRGPEGQYFFSSYFNLRPYIYVLGNGNFHPRAPMEFQPTDGSAWNMFTPGKVYPGQFGANASKLWEILQNGHYQVELTPEEKRAIALWLDNNCDFFGAYELDTLDAQRRGEKVEPTLE